MRKHSRTGGLVHRTVAAGRMNIEVNIEVVGFAHLGDADC